MINKQSPVPLYYQIKLTILEMIKSEVYKVGEKLPTDREFCEEFEVSRISIRRALLELESEGYIYKVQGKGSYVKFKELKQNLNQFYSFTNEIIKMGLSPSSVFLNLEVVQASRLVSKQLDIDESDFVYLLERLRLADESIVAYDRSYMPVRLFPDFMDKYKHGASLYQTFENQYNIIPDKADEILEAISISKTDAVKMRIPAYSPQLLVQRVAYAKGIKVEFNYRLVNSSLYKYRITLE